MKWKLKRRESTSWQNAKPQTGFWISFSRLMHFFFLYDLKVLNQNIWFPTEQQRHTGLYFDSLPVIPQTLKYKICVKRQTYKKSTIKTLQTKYISFLFHINTDRHTTAGLADVLFYREQSCSSHTVVFALLLNRKEKRFFSISFSLCRILCRSFADFFFELNFVKFGL